MTIDFYINNGFEKIGYLTCNKPIGKKKRKHGAYFVGNPPKSKGVYFLAKDEDILKFGETSAQDGMYSRIQNYLSNTEATNVWIRENLEYDQIYDVYFFEIISKPVQLMGVIAEESITPRSLERALIENYINTKGTKPRLNRSIK